MDEFCKLYSSYGQHNWPIERSTIRNSISNFEIQFSLLNNIQTDRLLLHRKYSVFSWEFTRRTWGVDSASFLATERNGLERFCALYVETLNWKQTKDSLCKNWIHSTRWIQATTLQSMDSWKVSKQILLSDDTTVWLNGYVQPKQPKETQDVQFIHKN